MQKPMKPETAEINTIPLPCLASPKLDGIRGRVIDGVLRSNTNKTIPNEYIAKLFSRQELTGYDGEIIVGSPTAKNVCHVTAGTCSRTKFSAVKPEVTLYVFDNFAAPGGYRARLATLKAQPHVVILEQTLIQTREQLAAYVEKQLDAGYEGIITRALDGPYKEGRSTAAQGWMLRIKPREDAEAEILEVIEEQHNGNAAMTNGVGRTTRSTSKAGKTGKGRAGALRCRDLNTAVEFTMGGFDDKERFEFWANREAIAEAARIGRPLIAKYQRQKTGAKVAPRSPIYQFLVARPRWDVEGLAA